MMLVVWLPGWAGLDGRISPHMSRHTLPGQLWRCLHKRCHAHDAFWLQHGRMHADRCWGEVGSLEDAAACLSRVSTAGAMDARAACVNCMRSPSRPFRGAMELARRLAFFKRALCSHALNAFHSGTLCRNLLSCFTCTAPCSELGRRWMLLPGAAPLAQWG